jgi:hypothetical protein
LPCRHIYAEGMSEPAYEPDVPDLASATGRPVKGGLTIDGQRVVAIFPEATIDALGFFAKMLVDESQSDSLPALVRQAMPWSKRLSDEQIRTFASELAMAASSGADAPERVAAVMLGWRDSAELSANPDEAERLRRAADEAHSGKARPWRYDDEST